MTKLSIVTINGEFFDYQIGLSNKQSIAIQELIQQKNEYAKEKGLNHNWCLDEYSEMPNIVEFIANIKQGYIEEMPISKAHEESEDWQKQLEVRKEMALGSI